MKTWPIILFVLVSLSLQGCLSVRPTTAPEGMTPQRKSLDRDPYGSYVSLITTSNETINGEFIGIYGDSLIIWDKGIKNIHPKEISQGKIYVFEFNSYWGYMIPGLIPNLALLALVPEYGEGPFLMASIFSGFIVLGGGSANWTELKKQNHFDWHQEQNEFLKYARFPKGIPPDVDLYLLEGKTN